MFAARESSGGLILIIIGEEGESRARRNFDDDLVPANTQNLGLAAQAVALALSHLLSSLRTSVTPSRTDLAPLITRLAATSALTRVTEQATVTHQRLLNQNRDIEEEHEEEEGGDEDDEDEEDILDDVGLYAVRYPQHINEDGDEPEDEENENTEVSDTDEIPELYDGDSDTDSDSDYSFFQKPLR